MFRLRREVYLDHNATTPVSDRVRRRMCDSLRTGFGNPSSRYRAAQGTAAAVARARDLVAGAVGALAGEIIFTGSASEANNQILKTFTRKAFPSRPRIVASPIEHPSVASVLEQLAADGMEVIHCPVEQDGRVRMAALAELIDDRTALVCCMFANNETGVVQDVAAVVALAHGHGALVFSDCVQALGKVPLNVHALGVDYATFAAHKIRGPKGIGALYARADVPLSPLIHGGHQENGIRAGTESTHNIVGFGEACRDVPAQLSHAGTIARLRDQLRVAIAALFPDARFNTPFDHAVPNTLSVTLPGVDNAEALAYLDYYGIAAAAGSACNTTQNEPSHVLKAMGLGDEEARQTLRFSLSSSTTAADIKYVGKVLSDYVHQRRAPVTMVRPTQVTEELLFNGNLFILDIRSEFDRKVLKGLPRSHEVPLLSLKRYLHDIPRDRTLLVVCQAGTDGPFAAYYLRAHGFRHVSFVMGGVVGWKLFQPELYQRLGGEKTSRLGHDREDT